jgi:hypothetical protein
MTQQGQYFDATQFEISNGGGVQHPIGKFPGRITATGIAPTRNNEGNFLFVTVTTPAGEIDIRYNLWNSNAQAVDIAQKQLTALCYATGIYKLDMNNQGREFMNANIQIDVRKQPKNENYTEVGKVYDAMGNDPSKEKPATTQAPAQQHQPQHQPQQTSGFGQQPQPNQQQPQQEQPAGWSPANQGGGNVAETGKTSAPWGPK